MSDWRLEPSKLLTPSLSTDAVILGVKQPASVWVNTSVKVSVNSGRQSGLLQGQDHEIRSRDYHSSVRETTVCWALRLYKWQPG